MALLGQLHTKLAQLYFESGTFQFGEFLLSAHRQNPDLPPTPYYLHYPAQNEPGSELIPKIAETSAKLFVSLLVTHRIKPHLIAGAPYGAHALADALARQYTGRYPGNLLIFQKITHENGTITFTGPTGKFQAGDEIVGVEDHITTGTNTLLLKARGEKRHLRMRTVLSVVDRQQGSVVRLATAGVTQLSIFTIEDLVQFGLDNDYIKPAQADIVREYIANNQL